MQLLYNLTKKIKNSRSRLIKKLYFLKNRKVLKKADNIKLNKFKHETKVKICFDSPITNKVEKNEEFQINRRSAVLCTS